MKNIKNGFTLAEVLITLGIIGVVAAITLPVLITNFQKKQIATAVKKAYSELSQALKLSETDNGEMQYWDYPIGSVEDTEIFVNKYIKPYYQELNKFEERFGVQWPGISANGVTYITHNATKLSIEALQPYIYVLVDVNGLKMPNRIGNDIFYFNTTTGKLMPTGWQENLTREMVLNGYTPPSSKRKYSCKNTISESDDYTAARHGCTALLMLDNWEFKKDYPWQYKNPK